MARLTDRLDMTVAVNLDVRGRVVTKVVRTCDPTPLLYKKLAIKYV